MVDPGIINPKDFIDEVINVRFPNPYMPDTPQRIATDTSQKVSVRFGQTIKRYMEDDEKSAASLKYIPLAIAGWLRYLLAIDDNGNEFELSPDPLMDELEKIFGDRGLGELENISELEEFLQNKAIFGVNLSEAGLSEKVISYYRELSEKPGAVRETLKKYLSEEEA